MNTNVGTRAFMTPEFFNPDEKGSILYHRNVDTYAATLTFLALLQWKEGKLIPRIETPTDESE